MALEQIMAAPPTSFVMPARSRKWTKKEDDTLRVLINQYGAVRGRTSETHWSNISKHIPGRTNKGTRSSIYMINIVLTCRETAEKDGTIRLTQHFVKVAGLRRRIESCHLHMSALVLHGK